MKSLKIIGLAALALAMLVAVGCDNNPELPHEHVWNEGKVTKEATCTEDGVKTFTCACGETKTESIAAKGHTFSEVWVQGEKTHWHECNTCGAKDKEENHIPGEWETVTAATEENAGEEKTNCTVCGYEMKKVIPELNHVHDYSGDWQQGEKTHWKECGCGAKSDEATHGSTTGWKYDDSNNHWKICDDCNAKFNEEEHSFGEGVVTKPATCTTAGEMTSTCKCGKTKIDPIPAEHTWVVTSGGTATTRTSGTINYKCSVCGATKTETGKLEVPASAVSLDTLGAKKQLSDTELAKYGITASSIPAKIDGATYYTFGVYPQTIKADDVDVDETIINLEFDEVDYYLGNDNNWYAKCLENACVECDKLKYSDGTDVKQSSENSYKYFKVEPIVWRKLEGSKYLLAEQILIANVSYYGSSYGRSLNDSIIYANNYKYSNIRAWLNGINNQFVTDGGGTADEYNLDWSDKGFLQTAFTQSQRDQIKKTDVYNSAFSTTDATGAVTQATDYACENTQDKIFLLSLLEATTMVYGFAAYNESGRGNSRIRLPTDYAKANYAYQGTTTGYGGYWWLRSPTCSFSNYVWQVEECGDTRILNYGVTYKGRGVVPALSLIEN